LGDLQEQLEKVVNQSSQGNVEQEIQSVLDGFGEKISQRLPLEDINRCFGGGSVEEIVAALNAHSSDWAKQLLSSIQKASPTSLKVRSLTL
jgi:hypothetical protein